MTKMTAMMMRIAAAAAAAATRRRCYAGRHMPALTSNNTPVTAISCLKSK